MPHMGKTNRSQLQTASLDHSLWFHRPFNVEDWILFVRRTTTAVGSRGMNHAEFFDRHGNLIASASQEGLMRMVDPKRKSGKRAQSESEKSAEQEQTGE
jgi:acyl-CoA thioesterase II